MKKVFNRFFDWRLKIFVTFPINQERPGQTSTAMPAMNFRVGI
jgi:hypothetical protein